MGLICKEFVFFFTDTDVYQYLVWVSKLCAPEIDKKCPSCSRIVPDAEYTTNLSLKISMLVQTFCVPPPAIQQ